MVTCPKCGTKNNDNFNCCYNCGTPLNSNTDEFELAAKLEEDNVAEQKNEESLDNTRYATSQNNDINNYQSAAYRNQQTTVRKKASYIPPSQQKKGPEISVNKIAIIITFALVIIGVIWAVFALLDNWFSGPVGGPTESPTPTPSYEATPTPPGPQLSLTIVANDAFETDEYGDKYINLTVATNASKIVFMDKEYVVENSQVHILNITEYAIFNAYRPAVYTKGEKFNADIPITAMRAGYPNVTEYLTVKDVSTPRIPVTIIDPVIDSYDSLTSIYSGKVYKTDSVISFSTISSNDLKIYINSEDLTNYYNNVTGVFSYTHLTPPAEEAYHYHVQLECSDYEPREFLLELTRSMEHNPNDEVRLELNSILYTANPDNTVAISGTFTGAHDDLTFFANNTAEANLVVQSINFSSDGSGMFTAILECKMLGWTEILVECTSDYGLSKTIYVKNLSDALGGINKFYNSSQGVADKMDILYGLQSNYNGTKMVLGYGAGIEDKAVIKSVTKVETGVAALVNVTPSSDTETLVWVEFCQDKISKQEGDTVKIFATKTGAHDGMPRFLAVAVM